jgi:predicted glycosyl hydrolase (DUF1957 family)
MGRPSLSLGTAGRIRIWREPNGQWTARCLYRDADGKSRLVERTRHTKTAAERALKEALRDRTPIDATAEIKPDTKVWIVAEASSAWSS